MASKIPQYGWKCLKRMWICLNVSKFAIIDRVLNMSYAKFLICLTQCMPWGHSTSLWVIIERWPYSEPWQRSKIKLFGKIAYLNILKLSIGQDSEQCYAGFTHFRKYDKVWIYIRQDAILEEFWIFQYSRYTKFLHMNMPEYGGMMPE